jgi:carbon-monoxide dehydrogenase medium subunit/xanthine dehydrogenase FAD-binding subunit
MILAGGTDLVIALNKKQIEVDYLIDISSIDEIKQINEDENEIILGAGVTFRDILDSECIKKHVPALWKAALQMGACQIQNRATIGGNICNGSPAADSVPVFLALDAKCLLRSSVGQRWMCLMEFMQPSNENVLVKTQLNKDEMLEAVAFRKMKPGQKVGFSKLGKRNALAIAAISCAVNLEINEGIIKSAKVFTGCLGLKATEELETEKYLIGQSTTAIDLDQAAEVLSKEILGRLGNRASIQYKKLAVKGVFKEAARIALDGREVN